VAADQRRLDWDERHRAGISRAMARTRRSLRDGRAEARHSPRAGFRQRHQRGLAGAASWRTTAVDWSPVGLANGKAKADGRRRNVDWLERDLFGWTPPARAFDLVVLVYLHLPVDERVPVYARAARPWRPAGDS